MNARVRNRAGTVVVAMALATTAFAGGGAPCPGDTNADAAVDVGDLVNVILDWGTDGSAHGGDVAGATTADPPNGVVDVQDLVAVILAWGDCPPANDDCADATALAVPSSVAGSTVRASDDPEAFTCGDPPVAPGAPGVWYHVVGTGETLTASMCASPEPYDAILQLYCGNAASCGLGARNPLLCADADDDGCGLPGDGTVATVTWCSGVGEDYMLRVAGVGAAVGDFQLDVSAGDPCNTPETCLVCFCDNQSDDCADAIVITDGLWGYDTTLATTDGPAHVECTDDGDMGVTAEDIWFLYTAPTDGALMVTTCEQLGGSAEHDSDLVLYGPFDDPVDLGVECEHPSLLASLLACNDDDPVNDCGTGAGGFHSTLFAPVETGRVYLIRVGSWFTGNNGPGELLVQTLVANDGVCSFADDLALGAVTAVDTSGAGPVDSGPDCGGGAATAPGRWYRIVGDGTTYTAALCNDAANPGFDTRLSVYCGGCDDLFCVGDEAPDNAPACGPNETLSWCTFPGAEYLVLVHGDGPDETGLVDLTVTTDGAPCAGPACLPPDACGGVVFQPRRAPEDGWTAYLSDDFLDYQHMHERFQWPGGRLRTVRWWGFDLRFTSGFLAECNTPAPDYEIAVHASIGGIHGPQPDLAAGPFHVESVVPTLVASDVYPVSIGYQSWAFTADLAAPLDLPAGDWWISIRDVDGSVCMFYWLTSRIGDGSSMREDLETGAVAPFSDNGTDLDDLSLCINPPP